MLISVTEGEDYELPGFCAMTRNYFCSLWGASILICTADVSGTFKLHFWLNYEEKAQFVLK